MSTSTFLHHYRLLLNFHLVTGRSIGIFFPPFKWSLCCPETLRLLSAAFHPTFQLPFVCLREASSLGSTRSCWTVPCHPKAILGFHVAHRDLCVPHRAARGGLRLRKTWHLFPVDVSHRERRLTAGTSPSCLLKHGPCSLAALESYLVWPWIITYKWYVCEGLCIDYCY